MLSNMLVEVLIYRSLRVMHSSFTRKAINAGHDIRYKAKPSGEAKDSIDTRLSGHSMESSSDSELLMIEKDLMFLQEGRQMPFKAR